MNAFICFVAYLFILPLLNFIKIILRLTRLRAYSYGEEVANTISHAIGIVMGLAAGGFLLVAASQGDEPLWKIATVLIYLMGMLTCYTVSSLYHGCRDKEKKKLLQKYDHASIYVHIAATYTPFTLLLLRKEGAWGWIFFVFIWVVAAIGVCLSFRTSLKHSNIETVCYVVMGCSIFIAFKPLINALHSIGQIEALYWLMLGGVSYIVGALFYSLAKKEYMHTVFHVFVLGGSICHILAIYMIL